MTILIGEDDSEARGYLELATLSMGFKPLLAENGEEVLSCLQRQETVHAVLLDIMMPRKDGLETLQEIRRWSPSLPVIMVSDASSTLNVVQAMRIGATDFLSKPVEHDDLKTAIERATKGFTPDPLLAGNNEIVREGGKFLLAQNHRMAEIAKIVRDVAPSDVPVLIRGETGVGKEVVARELHALSLRSRKPFLKLNCAALPAELVESELFGYERGAFTGAHQRKPGLFELADGGTILLDEIGDMDFKLQAKLLQVLQDHEFQRVGGRESVRVNIRVIAATHQNLEQAITNRQFREDLFYRLNVISIEIPPLRNRKEDLIALAEHLLRKSSPAAPPALTAELKRAMVDYQWPGNIRELENLMRRYAILRHSDVIVRELRDKTVANKREPVELSRYDEAASEASPILVQVSKAKHQAEASAILAALSSTRWNRKQAAVLLQIDYKALLYKMKKLGISDDGPNSSESAGSGTAAFQTFVD